MVLTLILLFCYRVLAINSGIQAFSLSKRFNVSVQIYTPVCPLSVQYLYVPSTQNQPTKLIPSGSSKRKHSFFLAQILGVATNHWCLFACGCVAPVATSSLTEIS